MAKDNSKITDVNIQSQWKKQNDAHKAQFKILVRIAEEYGLSFDEEGEVLFEGEANNKVKSNVPNATPMAIDTTQLSSAIKAAFNGAMPKVDTSKITVQISPDIHIKNNNEVFNTITDKWDKWIEKYIKELLRAHGVVEDICIDGKHAYKMEEPTSNVEHVPYTSPKKPSIFKKLRMRLWEDVVSSFWKGFAYSLLICCACFAYYEYYYNQKLVRIAKEYTIVRHYLEQYPDYKQRLNNIDTFLQEEDVYKVYEYVERQKNK